MTERENLINALRAYLALDNITATDRLYAETMLTKLILETESRTS